jgi:O-antigen/teichoic acid export membrane protein
MTAILSIQIIPFVIAGIMTQVLYAINRGLSYLRASTIMCIIAVGGFVFLIPNTTIPFSQGWGGIGAAISVSAAYIIFCIILCWMVRRYTKIRLYPKLWRVFIAFVLSAIAIWGIGQFVEVSGFLWLALVGFACEVIFIAILMAIKELKVSEIQTVLRMFIKDEDRIASAGRCGTSSCA